MRDGRAIRRKVKSFALRLPQAYEDHPWGEDVAKVKGKIFVFLGLGDDPSNLAMTVKLNESQDQALMVPGAAPSGYGLGRAGWVTIPFGRTTPPLAILTDWVEESYRLVAPRRLVTQLDESSGRRT